MTVLEDRVFNEVIKLRPLGWALFQSDWCPFKERKFEHTETPGVRVHKGMTMGKGKAARGLPSAGQGDWPQRKSALLVP